MKRLLLIIFFAFVFGNHGKAQHSNFQSTTDSLKHLITVRKDSLRVDAMTQLCSYILDDPDSVQKLARRSFELSQRIGYLKGLAASDLILGRENYRKGNYDKALEHFSGSIGLYKRIYPPGGGKDAAMIMNSIGLIHTDKAEYAKAMECFLTALKAAEGRGSKGEQASAFGNIAIVYVRQNQFSKSLEYFQKAISLVEKENLPQLQLNFIGNMANIYSILNESDKALEYYHKAIETAEKLNDKREISKNLANIGLTFYTQGKLQEAIDYCEKALVLDEELGDKLSQATDLGNIGSFNFMIGNLPKAKKYLDRSLAIADTFKFLEITMSFESTYSEVDSAAGNFKGAMEHYKKFIAARDSISNQENIKKQTQLEMQFDFDKKQTADSVRVSEERKVAAAELKTEKNKSYSLFGGLGLLLVFAVFIFNRYKVTQRQKIVIEEQKKTVDEQKKLVEEKQREILDSINYAKRIQMALMPGEKYLKKKMNDLS